MIGDLFGCIQQRINENWRNWDLTLQIKNSTHMMHWRVMMTYLNYLRFYPYIRMSMGIIL